MSPQQSSAISTPPAPSTAIYSLYDSILSKAICFRNSPLSPLQPSFPPVLSTALCLLYSPLSPLCPSIPSTAFCALYSTDLYPLYEPLRLQQPAVLSMALCPSTALCPLYFVPSLSFPFSPTVSPFLSLPLLSLHRSVSCLVSLCLISLTSGFYLSIFPICLSPFFSPFLLLSLPSVTPSVFSHWIHLCLSPLSLFSIFPSVPPLVSHPYCVFPLFILLRPQCLSNLISPPLSLPSFSFLRFILLSLPSVTSSVSSLCPSLCLFPLYSFISLLYFSALSLPCDFL